MAKSSPSDSDPEEVETPENSSSEDDDDCNVQKQQQVISEYEKQRLSRIAENKARMEALGLPKIASSFMDSAKKSSQCKGKRKVVHDDEDYRPIDDDHDDDDDDDDEDEEDLDDDEDEEFLGSEGPRSRKKKVNKKSPKPKKKGPVQRQLSSSDYIDGDDDDLMQAIALSLKDSAEVSGGVSRAKGNARSQEDTGRRKRKKLFTSRVQMTEDEVVLHFFQFDEAGTESISIRDLQRVAIAHDFMWTDKELADMIHCFDSDGDGKLSLDDFWKIVGRCSMIQRL